MSTYHFSKRLVTDGRRRNVVWFADTNYRVDLENDTVRRLAENDELDELVASDQASHRALRPFSDLRLISSFIIKAQECN